MEELITTFHIDWKLMLAQLVNFVIVFVVLWRFALKPLMKNMSERSATIEKSLKDAEAIDQKLKATEEETRQHISEARAQAMAILNETKKQAEAKRQDMLARAKQEVEGVIRSAKEQIKQEKESMLVEARNELAHLVGLSLHKIMGASVDKKVDEQYIKDRIRHLK